MEYVRTQYIQSLIHHPLAGTNVRRVEKNVLQTRVSRFEKLRRTEEDEKI